MFFPSGKEHIGRHQFLNWCQQISTGYLHVNGFDSLLNFQKKMDTVKVSIIFGAGYGSRTRLHGLGSRCITDIRILRMCGYYSRAFWKIQPLIVEENGRLSLPFFIPLPKSDAWVLRLQTALRCCRPSKPLAWGSS